MSSVAYSFFYDRGRVNSKTKPISSIGEKIADANSVVLLKPLCASSVAGKERRVGSVRHVTLANTARLPLYIV